MYLLVARDKSSEWRAIKSLRDARGLPFGVLAEAVCEPLRASGVRQSNSPDAVVTRLAVRIGELPPQSWVAADLDNLLIDLSPGDVASLVPILGRFGSGGAVTPIPTVRTSTPLRVRAAFYELAKRLGKGLVIRLDGVNHLEVGVQALNEIVLESELPTRDIDIVVDAKDLPQFVALSVLHDVIGVIPTCRSWTFLSGTFPGSITHLSPTKLLHRLDRIEWTAFREQAQQLHGRRLPWFGDYATQASTYQPSDPFRPSPSVRYTTEDGYLVLRGKRDAPEGYSQYIGHARVLQSLPDFGVVVAGDAEDYVRMIATGQHSTGNGTTWRIASIQRHVALSCAQEAVVRKIVQSAA